MPGGSAVTPVRKIDFLLSAMVAALVLLTWLPRLGGPIDLRWDGGVYYVLGTSLADGAGYRLLNEPGDITANQYPPLFPAIIALHQKVAGTSDPTEVGRLLRVTFLLLSIGLGIGLYALFRRYVGPWFAGVGAAVCMLHTSTVFITDIGFAELPFTLVTVLFFLVERGDDRSLPRAVAAGALAVAAFLLRTTGVALLAAWVISGLLQRRLLVAAARFVVVVPFVLAWQIYTGAVERQPAYEAPSYSYQRADYLFYNVKYARNVTFRNPDRPDQGHLSVPGLAGRLARNLLTAPRYAAETISAVRDDWRRPWQSLSALPAVGRLFSRPLLDVGLFLFGGLVLAGLARQLHVRDYAMALYVLLYVAAICVTPWVFSDRYWIPLAPMMIVALTHLLGFIGEKSAARAGPRFRRWAPSLLVGGVCLVLIVQVASLRRLFRDQHQAVTYLDRQGRAVSYDLFYYRDTYRALDDAIDWLREDAPPNAIVAASMPHWVYLRSGLKSIMPPFEPDPVTALRLLESVPVRYLLVDGRTGSFTRVFGLPAVSLAPDRWESVFEDVAGEVEVFRRVTPQ
jgi:hypothetical protein